MANKPDFNRYLFPQPELLESSNAELRSLIAQKLPTALEMVDGTGATSVQIDTPRTPSNRPGTFSWVAEKHFPNTKPM